MTALDLITPLLELCEIDPPEITGQGIGLSGDHAVFNALIDMSALIHVGNADTILCSGCDHSHSVSVEYAGQGQYRSYCSIAGYQQIEPNQLQRFAISEAWLAQSIASNLHVSHAPQFNATPSAAIRIGRARFNQYVCEVFFARLGRAIDALLNGILEAFFGARDNLRYSGYRH